MPGSTGGMVAKNSLRAARRGEAARRANKAGEVRLPYMGEEEEEEDEACVLMLLYVCPYS